MAPAASNAASTGGTMPVASITTMASRITIAGVDPRPAHRLSPYQPRRVHDQQVALLAAGLEDRPVAFDQQHVADLQVGVLGTAIAALPAYCEHDQVAVHHVSRPHDLADEPRPRRDDHLGRAILAREQRALDVAGGADGFHAETELGSEALRHPRLAHDREPVVEADGPSNTGRCVCPSSTVITSMPG